VTATAVKWAIFIVALLASYPAGRWLRVNPRLRLYTWTLVGLLPFSPVRLEMSLIFFGTRLGDTNGFEVALIDWLVVCLYFAEKGNAKPAPYRTALGAYLVVAVASATQAAWPLGAFGYVWKLCRMYLLFVVAFRAGEDRRMHVALLRGMMAGVLLEASMTAWQHYGEGVWRATGTFAHQNTLGVVLSLVVMTPLALLLAGQVTTLNVLVPVVALPACIFTVSRGAVFFLGAGSVVLYLLSLYRSAARGKALVGLAGLTLALLLVPAAIRTLGSRSAQQQASSMELRTRLEDTASLMLREHPFGVGPNHFQVMLGEGGYGERGGIDEFNRSALVHNIYMLTLAEMGYAGLVALGVLFLSPLVSAFRWAYRARRDLRGDVLLGLGVGLLVFYVHSLFEWAWRITAVTYVYWMTVAIVASLTRQLEDERSGRVAVSGEARTLSPGRRRTRVLAA
jgi:O-antigen ligase